MDSELHERAQTILRLHRVMRWGELVYGAGMMYLALILWPDVSAVQSTSDAGSVASSAGIAAMFGTLGLVAVLSSLLKWRGDAMAREIERRWQLHCARVPTDN